MDLRGQKEDKEGMGIKGSMGQTGYRESKVRQGNKDIPESKGPLASLVLKVLMEKLALGGLWVCLANQGVKVHRGRKGQWDFRARMGNQAAQECRDKRGQQVLLGFLVPKGLGDHRDLLDLRDLLDALVKKGRKDLLEPLGLLDIMDQKGLRDRQDLLGLSVRLGHTAKLVNQGLQGHQGRLDHQGRLGHLGHLDNPALIVRTAVYHKVHLKSILIQTCQVAQVTILKLRYLQYLIATPRKNV